MPSLPTPGERSDWFVRHRLKLRHLNVLLAVERTCNIGRAARELHTSQPAVSKALQEVERAAGVPLFERRAEGTYPTAAGQALIRYSREVFGALDRAGRELASIASGLAGTLAVGANFSAAAERVPMAIARLKQANPRLTVTVREATLEVLMSDLRARTIDVLVARWPRGRQIGDLEEHSGFEQAMSVVCAPNDPLAKARPVTWSMLAGVAWILPPRGSAARDDLEELFRLRRIRPKEAGIECASAFANSLLMRELSAVATAPLAVARPLQAAGLLAILPVKMPPVFGPNSVITLRSRELTPAMSAFIQAVGQTTHAEG